MSFIEYYGGWKRSGVDGGAEIFATHDYFRCGGDGE
jgi:hypothetical protein